MSSGNFQFPLYCDIYKASRIFYGIWPICKLFYSLGLLLMIVHCLVWKVLKAGIFHFCPFLWVLKQDNFGGLINNIGESQSYNNSCTFLIIVLACQLLTNTHVGVYPQLMLGCILWFWGNMGNHLHNEELEAELLMLLVGGWLRWPGDL
jgi:hypothetical protein